MITKKHKGMWPEGVSGNPSGRPKGTAELDILKKAIKEVGQRKKLSLYKHAARRAYESDTVLIAVLRKLIADISEIDHSGQFISVHFDKQDKGL